MNLVETSGSLHPDVMEKWVSSTLKDAHNLNIPKMVLKSGAEPLERYHIDRRTLNELGFKRESVDRLYKALFVYSLGFHQFVYSLTKDLPNSFSVMTSIWKVFLILLEYCNKVDYEIMLNKINSRYKDELKKTEMYFENQMQAVNDKIVHQNIEIKTLEDKISTLNNSNKFLSEKNQSLESRNFIKNF